VAKFSNGDKAKWIHEFLIGSFEASETDKYCITILYFLIELEFYITAEVNPAICFS